jgi:hypothetical protein
MPSSLQHTPTAASSNGRHLKKSDRRMRLLLDGPQAGPADE